MEPEASFQIAIEYQLTDSLDWHALELTPDEYFRLEPNEKVQLRSLPKYNHAFQYLSLERDRLSGTKIVLIDKSLNVQRYIVERFWNKGQNRLLEKTDIDRQIYGETILEIMIGKEPPLWEIVKVMRQDGVLTSWYRGFSPNTDEEASGGEASGGEAVSSERSAFSF